MKLCVDCRYFMHANEKCGRTSLPDPVRGMPVTQFARIERAVDSQTACGPSAKFFEIALVAA
jgi:hypothetical protein